MSEITDLLEQKAGLSPDKAQEVEQIVLQHLGSRIPPEFQGTFNSLLGGGASAEANPRVGWWVEQPARRCLQLVRGNK